MLKRIGIVVAVVLGAVLSFSVGWFVAGIIVPNPVAAPAPWTPPQRAEYAAKCAGQLSDNTPAWAAAGFCACWTGAAEARHPYSWVVDGKPLTEKEEGEAADIMVECQRAVNQDVLPKVRAREQEKGARL